MAGGYAWLSYAIVLSMMYFDAEPDGKRVGEAVRLARRGVELDDKDALTHFAYGRALLARRAYPDALAEPSSIWRWSRHRRPSEFPTATTGRSPIGSRRSAIWGRRTPLRS
jgi:hypothetical protein